MLQSIRDKITGWIAYGVIFLISIPFALWGINSYLGGGEVLPAATVNGTEISARQLDQAYANYRQRLTRLFGGTIPSSFGDENMLKHQVLDQLIEKLAVSGHVDQNHYRIGDAALNKIIRNIPAFQTDGSFDASIYQAQLRSLGYSPIGFEQEIRSNQAVDQFRSGIQSTAFVVPVLKNRFLSLANQSRKIRTLTLVGNSDSVEVSSSDIDAYYRSHIAQYRSPERIKVDYIELSLDNLKAVIDVNEPDLRDRYQKEKNRFTKPELRTASHILIKVDRNAAQEESDKALEKIKGIQQRINNGEEFSVLAKQLSEDPGSASDGGNLGEIEKGVMVPAFESVLFSMKVGEISEPVKTSFGWHLIQLNKVSGGETRSFESARADIADEIKTEIAESQIYDLVENLSNLAYEQPDSLASAAEQLGLTLATSDWFDRGSGTGIAEDARVRAAAFSASVVQQRLNSEAIELDGDRVVFLRLNQHQAPADLPLADVQEKINEVLIRSKVRDTNEQQGSQGLDALKAGKTIESLAVDWSVTIEDRGFINRKSDIRSGLIATIFAMPRPDNGLVYEGYTMPNGNYTVIELSAVLSSSDAEADMKTLKDYADRVSAAGYDAVVKLLSRRSEVVKTPLADL